jgi:hypothetical protein
MKFFYHCRRERRGGEGEEGKRRDGRRTVYSSVLLNMAANQSSLSLTGFTAVSGT